MRIEIRPVAIKREHDEQFRVHPRGRSSRNRQKFDRRIHSLAKLHVSISPQLHRKGRCEDRRLISGGLATREDFHQPFTPAQHSIHMPLFRWTAKYLLAGSPRPLGSLGNTGENRMSTKLSITRIREEKI
jgi:hypothetical protein